jgi:GxxExxY protein
MAILYKELSYANVGAAMEVHNVLGSGFLEAVYQSALAHEFAARDIAATRERQLPVLYKGHKIGYYVADFVVDEKIIVELNAVSAISRDHKAQAINYLVATGFQLAILLNFGTHRCNTNA